MKSFLDISYKIVDGRPLLLDLYVPDGVAHPPLVLFLHGGGWQIGTRTDYGDRAGLLASRGFAVANIDYRLSGEAIWPAAIDDVESAIEFLSSNGERFGYDQSKVAAWGASAGAHLAAMAAFRNPNLLKAVIGWFITSDLLRAGIRPPLEPTVLPNFEGDLLGVRDVTKNIALARSASPRWNVHPDAPPFLLLHGDRDRIVPTVQSQILHDAIIDEGGESTLVIVGGASHEDPQFDQPKILGLMTAFLLTEFARQGSRDAPPRHR